MPLKNDPYTLTTAPTELVNDNMSSGINEHNDDRDIENATTEHVSDRYRLDQDILWDRKQRWLRQEQRQRQRRSKSGRQRKKKEADDDGDDENPSCFKQVKEMCINGFCGLWDGGRGKTHKKSRRKKRRKKRRKTRRKTRRKKRRKTRRKTRRKKRRKKRQTRR
jgi:hypothetical protein